MATVKPSVDSFGTRNQANPASPIVEFVTLVPAGSVNVTNGPVNTIDGSSVGGNFAFVRAKYDRGLTPSANPQGYIVGSVGAGGKPFRLRNRLGAELFTLPLSPSTDYDDGTAFKYTSITDAVILDRTGTSHLTWVPVTALAGAGTVNNAEIEIKLM